MVFQESQNGDLCQPGVMPRPWVKLSEDVQEQPSATSPEILRQNFCEQLNLRADSEIHGVVADINCIPVANDKDVIPLQVFLLCLFEMSVLIDLIFSKGMTTKGAQNLCLTHRHLLSLIQNLFKRCCFRKAKYLIWSMILFGYLIGQNSGGRLTISSQKLPPDCYRLFKSVSDCPIKAVWDPSWNDHWGVLNRTCCSGFPGTQLHCQRSHSTNFPACLPDQKVPRGHKGQLVKDKKGNPHFEVTPCDSGTFEPEGTVSSNVTYPYCLRVKSRCKGDAQKLLCFNGPAADDLCNCVPGYRLAGEGCDKGFTGDDTLCWCEPVSCPDGQVPAPPVAQTGLNCSNLMEVGFSPNSSCVNDSAGMTPLSTLSTEESEIRSVTPSAAALPIGFKCLVAIIFFIGFVLCEY